MPFVTRKSLLTLSVLSGIAVVAIAGFVWSGVYNVGADDHHTRPVYALMESMRKRSIEVRASKLKLPDLNTQARIVQGSGNYNAMCMGCHLAPGMAATELSKGLYPAPPDLTKKTVDAAEAFWVIKHGIKASGMPAWGKSMGDEYIWGMVAFLEQLPKLDAQEYQALVASSAGHQHGGGETIMHDHEGQHNAQDTGAQGHHEVSQEGHHAGEMTAPHHGSEDASSSSAAMPPPMVHTHADGKEHVHGH